VQGERLTVERREGLVLTIRNAEPVRLYYFSSKAEALEAVGLSK
jgi:hypothetical protein